MIVTALIVLAALVFILLLFIKAWNDGVLPMYWGLGSIALGLIVGLIVFQLTPEYFGNFVSQLKALPLIAAIVIGGIAYLISRSFLKWALGSVFHADSFLHRLTDGFFGGMLSLIPSIGTIIILSIILRTTGTLREMRHFARVAQDNVEFGPRNYPNWPQTAKYRDAMEDIPFVVEIYDLVDPVSNLPKRNLVLLLLCEAKPSLVNSLGKTPEISAVYRSSLYQALNSDPEILGLVKERDHLALLSQSKVQQAAIDGQLSQALKQVQLKQPAADFFTSAERAEYLKSISPNARIDD